MPRAPIVLALVSLCVMAAPAWAEPQSDSGSESASESGSGSESGPADAESRDRQARQLYLDGDIHYAAGRYEKAAELFRRAYELSQRPELLFNLGNTFERMGQYARAAEYLRRYITSPKARDTVSVRERIRRLDASAKARSVSDAGVDSSRAKAEVTTSERRAATPLTESIGTDEPPDRRVAPSRRPAYIAFAVSGAAFAGALASGLAARSAAGDAEADCTSGESTTLCLAGAEDALDRERRYAIIADTSAVVGLATAGVGIYLWLRARRDPPVLAKTPAATDSVEPVMLPGGMMMRWNHVF